MIRPCLEAAKRRHEVVAALAGHRTEFTSSICYWRFCANAARGKRRRDTEAAAVSFYAVQEFLTAGLYVPAVQQDGVGRLVESVLSAMMADRRCSGRRRSTVRKLVALRVLCRPSRGDRAGGVSFWLHWNVVSLMHP